MPAFNPARNSKGGWTICLRLSDWVAVAGSYARVRDHLAAGRLRAGERVQARVGTGTTDHPQVEAWIVVHDQISAAPKHKQNPGTRREQDARAQRHA